MTLLILVLQQERWGGGRGFVENYELRIVNYDRNQILIQRNNFERSQKRCSHGRGVQRSQRASQWLSYQYYRNTEWFSFTRTQAFGGVTASTAWDP